MNKYFLYIRKSTDVENKQVLNIEIQEYNHKMSIFTTSLEPTLSKIPEQRKPPRRRSLTLTAKQNTLYDF